MKLFGLISLLLGIFTISCLVLVMFGLNSKSALPVAFVLTLAILFAVAVYWVSKESKKYRFSKAVKNYYEKAISKSPKLAQIYCKALSAIRGTAIKGGISALGLPHLKGTIFYDYYGELFESLEGLAMLYTQKRSWQTGELYNPYDRAIISKYDNLSQADEKALTLFPWLISLSITTDAKFRNTMITA